MNAHSASAAEKQIPIFLRFARNGGLPRPFRARNDIVKIYIAFILINGSFLRR